MLLQPDIRVTALSTALRLRVLANPQLSDGASLNIDNIASLSEGYRDRTASGLRDVHPGAPTALLG